MIRVVGHRGASGHAPENTLAAIHRAWEMGVDAVEFDVRLTADGRAVLLHDATLDRTTSGAGPVAARTLAEVRELDAGAWFGAAFAAERVPTLAEALGEDDQRPGHPPRHWSEGWATTDHRPGSAVSQPEGFDTRWLVELKQGQGRPEELIEQVLAVIAATGTGSTVRLISFDAALLAEAREQAPEIPRGIVGGDNGAALLTGAERLGCVAVHAAGRLVTPEFVAAARAAGRRVNAWTLNDREAILLAAHLGVDEITTDVPDVALAALRSLDVGVP